MMTMNRRDLCVAFSSFAALAAGSAPTAAAQVASSSEPVLAKSLAFPFDQLTVTKSETGESRAVVHGVLATGEEVEMHETTLLPGHMPHPPHKHSHSEFVMVREGLVEFDNDGTKGRLGPGGVMFAASNVMHGLKNIGTVNANYFVIAVGHESGIMSA
jgi:quercetin dioxygenase-like cupin family protein